MFSKYLLIDGRKERERMDGRNKEGREGERERNLAILAQKPSHQTELASTGLVLSRF